MATTKPHNIVFSPEVEKAAAKAAEIAEKYIRPKAAELDRSQEYNYEGMKACAEAGLLGAFIPKAYGGTGLGMLGVARIVEELSKADPGFGVAFAVNALGTFPIIVGGTEEQKRLWLPDVAAGRKLVAFCLSEKNAGSDAQNQKVRAYDEGDHYRICGAKKWTTNGSVAQLYSVFACTDEKKKSVSAFVVEKGTPGLSFHKFEDKMGIRSVPVTETHFDNVIVPKSALIGGVEGKGFAHAMMTLDLARPGVAAQAVGTAAGALDYAAVYANKRKQFGKPIASFQMVQRLLAESAMRVEAARYLVYACAASIDASGKPNSKMAAMAKCFASDTAMQVSVDAVQIFGGYGFCRDYPIEKYMRDSKILQIYEGSNEVQRMIIARWVSQEASRLTSLEAYLPTEADDTARLVSAKL